MTLFDLASDPSAMVRKAVAARTDAPAQALRPLTRDHDRHVREAVARNPSASVANLLRLVKDPDRWVRWAVAGNPACDESVRRVMAEAPDKELRGLLAEMRELEPELAVRLIDDVSPEVRERLATHTHDPDVITALMADRTVRVRKGLARNPRTTAEQRTALAQDPAVDVRAALVRAVQLDEADLERLVHDRSVQVRLAMATSEVIPPHIRRALGGDPDDMVAGAARDFRPASGNSPVIRAPRVGHRRSGSGPGRLGGAAR
ncbi:Leucine rich repeat variant [Micromonospora purpureochromogenes]|uniref:Leucine rich repeat variant n=2 Tax=Micromonospora purpureochromogenes TaxID=47872 RepID=A0A1C4Z5J9_9ACTN|nr:Leucine rich repeat variant [Micromonospora purpureochromogenes]